MEAHEKQAREITKAREQSTLDGKKSRSSIIEISDADYRTPHMPCDALEENEDCKPGQ